MNLSHPNCGLRVRRALDSGDKQAVVQCSEIESSVESVSERGQISCRILSEVERMVTPGQTGLEIAQHGVDPLELGQILWFASGHDGGPMGASGHGDGGKAGQSVGEHRAAGGQRGFGPLGDGLEAETRHGGELGAQRMAVIAERDSGDERDLVLRAPTGLAAGALTAEVGVIDLDLAFEHVALLAFGHRLHQLVVDKPRGGVAHPQLSLERERRQPGLGLTDEVDRQEPDRQGQFGGLEDGASDQRALMPAGIALEQLPGAATQHAMRRTAATRAAKTLRPARLLKRRLALLLGAVPLEKLRHRQARLELDSIHRHASTHRNELGQRIRAEVAHHVSLAYVHC